MAYYGIIPNSTPTEENDKSRQAEFEMLSRELADGELELATLENELAVFEKRYTRIISVLFAELDQLEQEIAQELLRLHPEERYKRNFQDAERKARASRDSVKEKLGQAEKKDFVPSEDLKNLYRRVAKTIHPDLAADEYERSYRTTLMAKANAAYRNGNQAALEQILVEWEHRDKRPIHDEIQPDESDRQEVEIRQIKIRLTEIGSKIAALKKSELYQLMLKVAQAEKNRGDLLADMAHNLEQQIHLAEARLDSLKRQKKS